MTPAARLQTAIEILDLIAAAAREGGAPADAIFAEAMRARRFAGSKDRRAIRALVYDAIRAVRSVTARWSCLPTRRSRRAAHNFAAMNFTMRRSPMRVPRRRSSARLILVAGISAKMALWWEKYLAPLST